MRVHFPREKKPEIFLSWLRQSSILAEFEQNLTPSPLSGSKFSARLRHVKIEILRQTRFFSVAGIYIGGPPLSGSPLRRPGRAAGDGRRGAWQAPSESVCTERKANLGDQNESERMCVAGEKAVGQGQKDAHKAQSASYGSAGLLRVEAMKARDEARAGATKASEAQSVQGQSSHKCSGAIEASAGLCATVDEGQSSGHRREGRLRYRNEMATSGRPSGWLGG